MIDGIEATAERYRRYAVRIAPVSPSYASWARSMRHDLIEVVQRLPPTKRQPELVFAVGRALGADPADPDALAALIRWDAEAFVGAVASSTMQANDPQRMAPILPLLGAIGGPIGLVDVGGSAGLCAVPDHVTLDYLVPQAGAAMSRRRIADASREPSIRMEAEASGLLPEHPATIDVVARVVLDPAPIDPTTAEGADRLTFAVPPEAVRRRALMRSAAQAVAASPCVRLIGTAEDDLDAALAELPGGCTPVVVTSGTLVYIPGRVRQRVVDQLVSRGVRWVSMERTGILHGVDSTVPSFRREDAGFATVALDGVAYAFADAYGSTVTWFRRVPD